MSIYNFPAVLTVISEFTPSLNENVIYSYMFDSYHGLVGKADIIHKSSVSKIKSGIIQFERDGKEYYLNNSEHMVRDLDRLLMKYITDRFALCDKLRSLIMSDSMDERDKRLILASYPEDEKSISAFLANVIIHSLNRPVKKGAESPLMSERINIPAVANCKYFCGREKELQALSEMLETHDKIFIQGIGGIGKSEFVKKFIKDNKAGYTNILFLTYSESLMNTIAGIPFKGDNKEAKIGELYSAHIDFLRYMREDTLIIIDNFDVLPETDCNFDELMELQCKIIFTTRCEAGEDYDVLKLGDLDKTSLFEMAEQLKLSVSDNETLDRIFCAVHYHTLACELIIRLLNKSAISPDELLEKLLTMHVNIDVKDKIRKGGSYKFNEHIHNLFRLFALTDEQKNAMLLLSLTPVSGISDNYYLYFSGSEDMNIINELCEIGLVIYDEHLIQVHSLIGEAAAADFTPNMDNCRLFIERLNRELTNHSENLENYMRQALILEIADRIVEFCDKNDADFYFLFLINACPYAETFEDKFRMLHYISEMEKYLPDVTDRYSKAVYLMCKAAYSVMFENDIDSAIEHTAKAYNLIPHVVGGGFYSPREVSICYNVNNNLGRFYLEKGDNVKAKKYLKAARNIQLAYGELLDPNDILAHTVSAAKLLERIKAESIAQN